MVFFRVKNVKGFEYAYLVENKWDSSKSNNRIKGSRQKVKGYVGRIFRLRPVQELSFLEFLNLTDLENYMNSKETSNIIRDLVSWEIKKHAIEGKGFNINLETLELKKGAKNIVFMINEGYLCNITLNKLLEFKPNDDKNDGYNFAKSFIEAGINIPQDVFIKLFEKLTKIQ